MADDPANIEGIQEQKAQESAQATKEQAVRQLLHALDPHPNDEKLSYRQVLERLENVIGRELSPVSNSAPAQEGDADGTV